MRPDDYRRLVALALTPEQIAGVMEIIDAREDARKATQRARTKAYMRRLGLSRGEWVAVTGVVFRRDGYICAYCGGEATEVDHVIPLIQGGTSDLDNLVPACRKCNGGKSGRTPEEWLA